MSELQEIIEAYRKAGLPIPAGDVLLYLLNQNRSVHPLVINKMRNEGHTRMDRGKYSHLFNHSGGGTYG